MASNSGCSLIDYSQYRLMVSVFMLCLTVAVSSAIDLKQPMIIPLQLTTPYASRSAASTASSNLRRLQKADLPTARMRLFDDLLANGYYTTRLHIGTPPQEFALIVDTGSTVTYVPCSTCEQCGNHQDPRFQSNLSSTYHPVKCNPGCVCDEEGQQCTYERRYAERSSSSGVLAIDVVSFGNESQLTPQTAVFGCENIETGDLYSQRADGIMGLGRGRLSIVDQLVEKHVIGDSFSLCYGGMDVGGGAMVLGDIEPPSDMVFSRSDHFRSPYYNIELKELHVAGLPLKISPKVFDGRHGTVLDSGTTYAYLPEEAFQAFKDAIIKELADLKLIRGPDPSYNDICFSGAGRDVLQLSNVFPKVEMVFGNGKKILLAPENYLFRHTKVSGAYCLGVFQNTGDSTTLLGGIIVRNTLVTYDRKSDKIGFWKTNCSELWKRLQSPGNQSVIPPVVPASNTSQEPDLSHSHSTLPSSDPIAGQLQISDITFEMLLSVNKSATSHNFKEVTDFILHELGLNDLQAQMLNSSVEGNTYHVRWRISPTGSTDFISNTTAMDIILRLQQHRMKLPASVGSYQLLEWKIEEKKTSWVQQHFVTVAVGIAASVLVLSLAIAIFLTWRHRQLLNSYQRVENATPEQELQPLSEA